MQELVDDYIAEEVYYREAIAMGLDRDDTVIRRRLRQKMEFVTDDVASAVAPTDAQLQVYLNTRREAAEILHAARGQPGLTARAPGIVAFVFGLLHGFGFAGALREVGLPERDVPLALLSFNLGLEAGQLLFIVAVVALLAVLSRLLLRRTTGSHGPWVAEARLQVPVAYVIGSVAAFWVVERVVAFWA